jgi:hypothetical protein
VRLRPLRPDIRVVGLEIDPGGVVPGRDGVEFSRGGAAAGCCWTPTANAMTGPTYGGWIATPAKGD